MLNFRSLSIICESIKFMLLRRYGSLKNFNKNHPYADADTDADTRVTRTALPVLHRGKLRLNVTNICL